jgi:LPXTG-motif cell wall-anchored protein
MTVNKWHTGLAGLLATLAIVLCIVGVASAQSKSTTSTPGASSVKTKNLSGTVVAVKGNQLIVNMSDGTPRVFTPPADVKFVVDGKELGLSELQPGTVLHATVTETTTPVMDRTVQTVEGTVWFAKGGTVVLTLPSGENKQYNIAHNDPVKFYDHDQKEITVFDLKKGMEIHATKITEAPRVEFMTSTAVTGTAPKAAVAEAQPEAAPEAAPAPAMAAAKKLPKTGSPLALIGLLGFIFTGASFAIRKYRR